MSAPPVTGSAATKRRVSGVVFMVVISLLVYLTVLMYQKAFTPVIKVDLKTDRIGNQLAAHSDVKIRGLRIGEVRSVRSDGKGATVVLALDPQKAKLVDKDVRARLLPKTLFGEKEVVLLDPASPSGEHLEDSDVISQDRSQTATETEKVIDELLPLLQALKPQDLSTALNALSTALRGRGDQLGENLVRTAAYLRELNPTLPTLQQDMAGLADFANSTADATPDLLTVLDNLSASSRNLVDERADLDGFLKATTTFAGSAQSVVADNEARLVALARDSKAPLELYARYATEFPCLAAGLARYGPIINNAFGQLQAGLHITVEAIRDNGGYGPGQEPAYRDSRPPYCDGLPRPEVPADEAFFDDGYRTDPRPTSAKRYLSPTSGSTASDLAQNQAVMAAVAGPLMGLPADEVPDLITLLFGPLAQGNTVGLA